jgi:hypothetical protein
LRSDFFTCWQPFLIEAFCTDHYGKYRTSVSVEAAGLGHVTNFT